MCAFCMKNWLGYNFFEVNKMQGEYIFTRIKTERFLQGTSSLLPSLAQQINEQFFQRIFISEIEIK